ncbi:hypothetical protein Tco_1449985 [Tanacetum coccineum]
MATTDKESSAAGTDNRPPMLEESDFESWKIRIERYIRGKPLGKLIWKSIKNGPSPNSMITVTTGEGEQQTQVTRENTDEEFTEAENNKERADIQATNILSQGLPRHIFNTLNQTESAKEIWENVELLMQGEETSKRLTVAEAFLADVECTTPYSEPLAITTTTAFEVSHKDAYDSDVDEAPHAAAAFMANLMQTGPSTGQGTNNDIDFHSEVHTYDNHFFDNMNLQVSQEKHGGEQLDFDVDSVIDDHDNTIPYHQYQLNNEIESVPTDVSSVIPGEIFVITILDDLRSQLAGHIKTNEEQSFDNDSLKAELERYKTQVQNLEQSKVKKDLEQLVFEHNKQNADLEEQLVSLRL